jgi:hypothetical protein
LIENDGIGPRNFGVWPKGDRRVERVAVEIFRAEGTKLDAASFRCPHPDCSIVLRVQWNLNNPELWRTIAEEVQNIYR